MIEAKGADRIEKWPIERLRGYARNARTHSEDQVAKIAASIAEFGFTNPVLAKADGELIAGHGRVMAAQKLGLTHVPVIVLDYLTDAQRRAYIIADNKIALDAGWDLDVLASEVRDLTSDGYDLGLTGFSDAEINALLDDGVVQEPKTVQQLREEQRAESANGEGLESGPSGPSLADRFGVPPFSVLNTAHAYWQKRKMFWVSIGIKSELGRGENTERGGISSTGAEQNLVSARVEGVHDGNEHL